MENPRPEKVAVVDEVRERLDSQPALPLLTEYRGLDVTAISDLRRALRPAGGEYKIYKNTLVRFAARDLGLELEELLTGPTAIAFVTERPTAAGDAVDVAKALRDFAKTNPNLVVKGGVLGDEAPRPPTRPRPWPTSSPARCCSPSSPARWLRRCSSSPVCSKRCPATSPTDSRPSSTSRAACRSAPARPPSRCRGRRRPSRRRPRPRPPAPSRRRRADRGARGRGRRTDDAAAADEAPATEPAADDTTTEELSTWPPRKRSSIPSPT